jgi:hypothetical protein
MYNRNGRSLIHTTRTTQHVRQKQVCVYGPGSRLNHIWRIDHHLNFLSRFTHYLESKTMDHSCHKRDGIVEYSQACDVTEKRTSKLARNFGHWISAYRLESEDSGMFTILFLRYAGIIYENLLRNCRRLRVVRISAQIHFKRVPIRADSQVIVWFKLSTKVDV